MTDETKPALRASDVEREQGIALLRDAVVEGRLTLEEFGDRVGKGDALYAHSGEKKQLQRRQ